MKTGLFATSTLVAAIATLPASAGITVTDLNATADVDDAVIADGGTTIDVAAGVTVRDITGDTEDILQLISGGYTVTNNGIIDGGPEDGIVGSVGPHTIVNNGTIQAVRRVIDLDSTDFSLTNGSTGVVLGSREALRIDLTGSFSLDNDGLIRSTGDEAVLVRPDGATPLVTIDNAATGQIIASGSGKAIEIRESLVGSFLNNAGVISSDRDTIEVNSGEFTINNFAGASISAGTGNAIKNDAGATLTIITAGDITTDAEVAINFGEGNSELTISGGTISGDITSSVAFGGTNSVEVKFENAAEFVFDDDMDGVTSLSKAGQGNTVLNGNASVGNATVTDGRLSVNGTLTVDVSVESGELGGDGTIDGNVSLLGQLGPGNSAGSLAILGDLDLGDGSNIVWDLGDASDELTVDGIASANGMWTLELVSDGAPTLLEYEVLAGLNADASFFSNLDQVILPDDWNASVTVGPDSVRVVVPEPTSLGILAVGSLLIARRRRHRLPL